MRIQIPPRKFFNAPMVGHCSGSIPECVAPSGTPVYDSLVHSGGLASVVFYHRQAPFTIESRDFSKQLTLAYLFDFYRRTSVFIHSRVQIPSSVTYFLKISGGAFFTSVLGSIPIIFHKLHKELSNSGNLSSTIFFK